MGIQNVKTKIVHEFSLTRSELAELLDIQMPEVQVMVDSPWHGTVRSVRQATLANHDGQAVDSALLADASRFRDGIRKFVATGDRGLPLKISVRVPHNSIPRATQWIVPTLVLVTYEIDIHPLVSERLEVGREAALRG